MKKRILFASFDLEIGGVERSLISLLQQFDYDRYSVDLMLYRHHGEFLHLLPKEVNLLPELQEYATFRKSIREIQQEKLYSIMSGRILAKGYADLYEKVTKIPEPGTIQMQLMWKFAMPFLPRLNTEYDVAVSYLWPHYFVAEKVNARKKVAWIHTDFSKISILKKEDLKVWNQFDRIMAVSEACQESFVQTYGELNSKVETMENLSSPDLVKQLSQVDVNNPMNADKRFKLLTVARFSHAKGIDLAIQALKRLRDRGRSEVVWYVVGYGGDETYMRQLIFENNLENHFVLLGKQSNPYPYMREADLYVQPSRYEGKAVTVGEAQILGKPVLITNYTTAKSQVSHMVDGYICDLSVEGLVDGIEQLYLNPNLRREIQTRCEQTDYRNTHMLQKLYKISS